MEKPSNKRRIIWIVVFVVIAFLIYDSIAYTPPVTGRVVDAKTGKPIKGAQVRMVWGGARMAFFDRVSMIYRVSEYVTDSRGIFKSKLLFAWKLPIIDSSGGQFLVVLAHGYKVWYPNEDHKDYKHIQLVSISSDREFYENLSALDSFIQYGQNLVDIHSNERTYQDIFNADQKFVNDEWKRFFETFSNGPVTREFEDDLARGYAVEIPDQAERMIKDYPETKAARSASIWIEIIKQLRNKAGR